MRDKTQKYNATKRSVLYWFEFYFEKCSLKVLYLRCTSQYIIYNTFSYLITWMNFFIYHWFIEIAAKYQFTHVQVQGKNQLLGKNSLSCIKNICFTGLRKRRFGIIRFVWQQTRFYICYWIFFVTSYLDIYLTH